MAFPAGDDRAGLRAMLDASVEGDTMGVGARRDGETMRFEYPAVVLVATKCGSVNAVRPRGSDSMPLLLKDRREP